MTSLASRTTIGVVWNFFEQLSRRGISVLVTLLLARFLLPEDFGLMAMMAVFITIATSLMDSGIRQAVIRKENATQKDFNTAFYSNLALGAIAYVLLYFSAPLIAEFYEEPRLVALIRAVGVVVLINSFQVIQVSILSRNLDFKAQLKASVPATMISGVAAVALAYGGAGVWALIAQMLIAQTLTTLLLWYVNGWRPSIGFDMASFREMYVFGYKLFLSNTLNILMINLYTIVIAKVFSSTIAGYYFFSDKIVHLVVHQLVTSIQTVTYPALSSLQNDAEKLKEGYRTVLEVTTFILFPVMLMLAALAEPAFELFFPEPWLPAVPYLQLMCIAFVLYPVDSVNLNILKVKGRSDLFLWLEVLKGVMVATVLFFTYRHGIFAILLGNIFVSFLCYIPNGIFSSRLVNYSLFEQLRDFIPTLLLASGVSGLTYIMVGFLQVHPAVKVIFLGSFALTLYLILASLMNLKAYEHGVELLKGKMREMRNV